MMLCIQTMKAEVPRPQIQIARAVTHRSRLTDVTGLYFFRGQLNEYVGILCVSAGGREQKASMIGALSEQSFNQFEIEGNRLADQFRVIIGGIRSPAVCQRVS